MLQGGYRVLENLTMPLVTLICDAGHYTPVVVETN